MSTVDARWPARLVQARTPPGDNLRHNIRLHRPDHA